LEYCTGAGETSFYRLNVVYMALTVAIMPPFYVYNEKNGDYSTDMENYYRE